MGQSMLPINPNPEPIINPQLAKDLEAWLEAQMQLDQDKKILQKLLLALHTMKNALFGCQEVMNQMMNINGDKVAGLSAVDNVDSDLRGMLSKAQGDWNDAVNNAPTDGSDNMTPKEKAALQDMVDTIQSLESFLKWQGSLGDKSILDASDVNNILDQIKSIKDAFGQTGNQPNWGNLDQMGIQLNTWIYNQDNEGNSSPQMQTIQGALQVINQSTSALSTTTNTNLQFTTEQYKQFMGILQTTQDAYLKFTATSVQNEKTN